MFLKKMLAIKKILFIFALKYYLYLCKKIKFGRKETALVNVTSEFCDICFGSPFITNHETMK